MSDKQPDSAVLERLFAVIESRRGGDPESSHTAALLAGGTAGIAGKVGEEAVEAVIEAVRGDRGRLIHESADLLYHLLVLWADGGVRPAEVWAELASRDGRSGIEEKRSRKKS